MSAIGDQLKARMARPQRHRLLQGHPALPLMRASSPEPRKLWRSFDGALWERRFVQHSRTDGTTTHFWGEEVAPAIREPAWIDIDRSRPLIVGVIPHTLCNPSVHGCGFCTFPHDPYDKSTLGAFVHATEREIEVAFRRHPALAGRTVAALYFGGATANLAREGQLQLLFSALQSNLDLAGAEVTLEGVPALFLRKGLFGGGLLRWLSSLPVRHRRVSMGVQTFDAGQIARMGRTAFGDRATVESVVARAHREGLTASGDFLFNLPEQSRASMLDDVRQAVETGLDQICLYHLVAYDGLGTPWSSDAALLASLPPVERASENWLAVREALLAAGFVQTSLTNFERKDVNATPRRFVYEELSFTPEDNDALGVGPLSISTFVDLRRRRAVKLVKDKELGRGEDAPPDLWFPYDPEDLRIFFLLRSLSRTFVSRTAYRRVFDADPVAEFGEAIEAMREASLVAVEDDALRLTPRGMFFADSIVGLIGAPRVEVLRSRGTGRHTLSLLEGPTPDFMG